MKRMKQSTSRILTMILAGILVMGSLPVSAFGSAEDYGTTTEIAAENASAFETVAETAEEDTAATITDAVNPTDIVDVPVTSYTVTLDANGGYFVSEWDDVLGEYIEKTEVLNKVISAGEKVSTYPVNEQTDVAARFLGWSLDRDGEMVWQKQEEEIEQGQEGYLPVESCVLYAVWEYGDIADGEAAMVPADTFMWESTEIEEEDATDFHETEESEISLAEETDDSAINIEEEALENDTEDVGTQGEKIPSDRGTLIDVSETESAEMNSELPNDFLEETDIKVPADNFSGTEYEDKGTHINGEEDFKDGQEKAGISEEQTEEIEKPDGHDGEDSAADMDSAESITSEAEPETVVSDRLFSSVKTPDDGNRYTVLLLDNSGSMASNSRLVLAKQAAIRFCEQMLAADGINYISIVSYEASIHRAYDFSNDLSVLTTEINDMYTMGGTNTNAALNQAIDSLRDAPEKSNKNIVLLSDGIPGSGAVLTDGRYSSVDHTNYSYGNAVYETAKSIDSTWNIYTLGFFQGLSGQDLTFGRRLMEDIQNHGYYDVTDADGLEFAFDEIVKDIIARDLDHWSFSNQDLEYGINYYLTDNDKTRLLNALSVRDREVIKENYFSNDILKAFIPRYSNRYSALERLKKMLPVPIWEGSCLGMAEWCLMVDRLNEFATAIDNKNHLREYECIAKVESAINFYHVQQNTNIYINKKIEFQELSQKQQLQKLEEMLEDKTTALNPNMGLTFQQLGAALIDYDFSNDRYGHTGGHALMAYDLLEGDYSLDVQSAMISIGRGESIDRNWSFDKKICIYDPSFPDLEDCAIYVTNDDEVWCLPHYGLVSSSNRNPGTDRDNCKFKLCTNNCSDFKVVDYSTGQRNDASLYSNNRRYIRADMYRYQIRNRDITTHVDLSGDWDNIFDGAIKFFATHEADSNQGTGSYVYLPGGDQCTLETEDDPLDFMLNTDSAVTVFQAGTKGSASFIDTGGRVSTDSSSIIRISMTSNDVYKNTSWHTVEAISEDADELALYPSDEGGAVVSGNLNKAIITVTEDNSTDQTEEISLCTDSDSVLIKEEDGLPVPYIDKDGNGSHESPLYVATGRCGDNLTWHIIEDSGEHTLTISGNGAMWANCVDWYDKWSPLGWYNTSRIDHIVIEPGVTTVSENAFIGLDAKDVIIPSTVEYIHWKAFRECTQLEEFVVDSQNVNYTAVDGVLFIKDKTMLQAYPAGKAAAEPEYTIPEGTQKVQTYAFNCAVNLKTVSFPDSMNAIYDHAFMYCTGLESLEYPEKVTWVPANCFYGCRALSEITFNSTIQSIGNYAFAGTGLRKYVIPESCTLNDYVFSGCDLLELVIDSTCYYSYESIVGCKSICSEPRGRAESFANRANVPFIDISTSLKNMDGKDCTVTGDLFPTCSFDGSKKTMKSVAVRDGTKVLKEGTEFSIQYSDNVNAGTALAIIKGIGTYTGSVTVRFPIKRVSIFNAEIADVPDQSYSKKTLTPVPFISRGPRLLKNGVDYTLSYSNNVNPGEAVIIISGQGNYDGEVRKTFIINKADLKDSVIGNIKAVTYTGDAFKPKPEIKISGERLTEGIDYSIRYVDNINAGTASVSVTGIGNCTGKKTATFKINKAAQIITVKSSAASVSVGKTGTVSITGNKGTKSFQSSNTGIATVDPKTGKVTAKKVGTVTITAASAATSNYNAASKKVIIKVVPAATSTITVANQAKGIKITWKKVTGANGYILYRNNKKAKTITSGSIVTWTDTSANTNGTKYVYKVVPTASTGNGTAKSLTTYQVARPAISSVKNSASRKMTVTWGKNAKATGCLIQYSTSKTFSSGNKTATVTKAGTLSKVVESLAKGKTYYVRIRTYKTVGSTKYWSAWSASKSVKISK